MNGKVSKMIRSFLPKNMPEAFYVGSQLYNPSRMFLKKIKRIWNSLPKKERTYRNLLQKLKEHLDDIENRRPNVSEKNVM